MLLYGGETWTLTIPQMQRLRSFENRILRKIYGPICEEGLWRIRYNFELYQLYKSPDVVTSVKISRLRWLGHVQRMGELDIPKRIMESKFEVISKVGLPRLQWIDGALEDLNRLKVKG